MASGAWGCWCWVGERERIGRVGCQEQKRGQLKGPLSSAGYLSPGYLAGCGGHLGTWGGAGLALGRMANAQ